MGDTARGRKKQSKASKGSQSLIEASLSTEEEKNGEKKGKEAGPSEKRKFNPSPESTGN